MRLLITSAFALFLLFNTSCSSSIKKELEGAWKVTDMKVYIANAPQQLIKNARIIALSTYYDFTKDGRYQMTIAKNSLESGLRYKGTMELNSGGKKMILETDTVMSYVDENWELVKRTDFNVSLYEARSMRISRKSKDQVQLSEAANGGTITYILNRINPDK